MTTTTTSKPRPWRRNRPRPRRPDLIVAGEQPLAEVTIYRDLVTLTRRTKLGTWRSYPVSPDAVAQTLAQQPSASGLLPPHTLGTGRVAGVPFLVTYLPPHRRTLHTPQQGYSFILPPLVWAGCGGDYRLFALDSTDYPTRTDLALFLPPFPNTYETGAICWGDVEARPLASSATLPRVLDLFMESLFNLHLAGGKSKAFPSSVIAKWAQLAKRRKADAPYPLRDLMAAGRTLAWLLEGGPWTH